MSQRLSVGRLMLLIAFLAVSLGLLRAWIAPENRFGFLGLMAWMISIFGIAGFTTRGQVRRFFMGSGGTALILWLAVVTSPSAVLGSTWDHVVAPAWRQFVPSTKPGYWLLWNHPRLRGYIPVDSRGGQPSLVERANRRGTICVGFPDLQALLLIPLGLLSLGGGLIAVTLRKPVPAPRPAYQP